MALGNRTTQAPGEPVGRRNSLAQAYNPAAEDAVTEVERPAQPSNPWVLPSFLLAFGLLAGTALATSLGSKESAETESEIAQLRPEPRSGR
jgi:hypothetical protein